MKDTDMFYMKVYKKGDPNSIADLLEDVYLDNLFDKKIEIEEQGHLEAEIIDEDEYRSLKILVEEARDSSVNYNYVMGGGVDEDADVFINKVTLLNFFAKLGMKPSIADLDELLEWLSKK